MEDLTREALETFRTMHKELTHEEAIELEALAIKLKNSEFKHDPTLLTMSYKNVAGLKMYHLTVGARLWLREVHELFDEQIIHAIALVYALCNSINKDAFSYDRKEIIKTLEKFGKDLSLDDADFDAISDFMNNKSDSSADYADILSDLIEQIKADPSNLNLSKALRSLDNTESEFNICDNIVTVNALMHIIGNSRDFWLWECSSEYLDNSIKFAEEVLSKQNKKSIDRDWSKNFIAFNNFVNKIKSRS